MTSAGASPSRPQGDSAVRRLALREDVLEICYWYQGEGFGDRFTAQSLRTFLASPADEITAELERLADEGALVRDGASYSLTADGKKEAGRLFHDSFADFQSGTHGECSAGCCDSEGDCDEDHARGKDDRTPA